MRHSSNNLRLEALSWRAKQLGVSYGVFSAQTSQEEANQICKEFEKLLEERRQAEMERWLANNNSVRKRRKQQ